MDTLELILGHGVMLSLKIVDEYVFVREPRGGFIVRADGGIPELFNEDGAAIMWLICRGDLKRVEEIYRSDPENVGTFIVEAKRRGHLSIRLRPFLSRRAGGGNCVSLSYFLPIALTIEATATCNASCPYCYTSRELRGGVIDVRALDEFLEKTTSIPLDSGRMVKTAVGAVDISGGEPLLHPRFPELLESILRHAKRASVLTNGILLHKYIDVISSYGGRVSLQVSIDSLDRTVYAEAKGVDPGVLDQVLSSVKELLRRGVGVSIAVPVSKINIGTLDRTVEGLKRMFGDAVSIRASPVLSIGGADPAYAFTPEEYGELAVKLSRYAQKLPGEVEDKLRGAASLLGNCGAGWKRAMITADGRVYPCPLFPRREQWLLGRIDEEPSKVFSSRVSRLLARLPRPGGSVCEHCQYEGWCMGCMARAVELWERGVPCLWARRHLEPEAPH